MPPPLLETITPPEAIAGGDPFELQALGEKFVYGAEVLVNGTAVPTVFETDTLLLAALDPSGAPPDTLVPVAVRNPDGSTSNALDLAILAPPPANLFAPENEPHPYRRYDIQTTYVKDNGTLLMPIAGPPGTPAAVIQVCAPYGRKIVDWTLERQGADPEPPAPTDDPDQGIVLERQEIRPLSKLLMADGLTHVHRMTGQYVYLLTLPQDETGPLQIGSPPYDLTPPEENIVSPGQYKPGII